ncbi:putative stress response protein NST1-like [Sesbania bispinosa]|nr:putative stress response protein NST1-like [Sesbania bispinosa]
MVGIRGTNPSVQILRASPFRHTQQAQDSREEVQAHRRPRQPSTTSVTLPPSLSNGPGATFPSRSRTCATSTSALSRRSVEHEKQMMQMHAEACHNQMQILGSWLGSFVSSLVQGVMGWVLGWGHCLLRSCIMQLQVVFSRAEMMDSSFAPFQDRNVQFWGRREKGKFGCWMAPTSNS